MYSNETWPISQSCELHPTAFQKQAVNLNSMVFIVQFTRILIKNELEKKHTHTNYHRTVASFCTNWKANNKNTVHSIPQQQQPQ